MNNFSNLDETHRDYLIAPTDDFIRFWRLKVKVAAGVDVAKLNPLRRPRVDVDAYAATPPRRSGVDVSLFIFSILLFIRNYQSRSTPVK